VEHPPARSEPTEAERAAVASVVGPEPSGPLGRVLRRAPDRRHLLLPVLHALQDRVGWISPAALDHVAVRLAVPVADCWGVATFYDLIATEPQPPTVLHVCDDVACRLAGAGPLVGTLREGAGDDVAVRTSPCLGQCERAPAVFVQQAGDPPGHRVLAPHPAAAGTAPAPPTALGERRLLARVGVVDPQSLADHEAHGGLVALRRAVAIGSDAVVAEITASGLKGRGGAAFPTGVKWGAVASAVDPVRYVVANADESEPGTFKDRVLLEGDPFGLVEAMAVAGLAVGAEQGFVYLRGEYPLAEERLRHAIGSARAAGVLGDDVLGSGRRFDLELRRGAGAYICGEETALFESVEGRRGEPRNKPPFPTTHGLFGKPTVVNNVETLHAVLGIVAHGADWHRSVGTADSPGTKLFCLSGRVGRPGVYEVPHGTTLRTLLDAAGGVTGDGRLQAVLLGGAAGAFIGPELLDLPLTLEDARTAGVTLGSGVVLVLDGSVDAGDLVGRIAEFFRHESCGQCVPCRVGTQRQVELVERVRRRGRTAEDDAILADLAAVMGDASICGLGHTASGAVRSALALGLLEPAP
jgi:NADH-quinone oxidoreductase subunit F